MNSAAHRSRLSVPLLATADDLLLSEAMRLAAAAGVTPEVVRDPATAARRWGRAPIVLVGSDLAASMAQLRPQRRPRVHVLALGDVPDGAFRDALAVGAESVAGLPASEGWLVEQLTDAGDGTVTSGKAVGVVGGSGGAGATVWACALARSLSAYDDTVLVDLDPYGAGVDHVLGLEQLRGVCWDSLVTTTGRLSARSLREALPRDGRLALLGWSLQRPGALAPFAAREAVSAAVRGYRHVVLDLPRHPDPAAEEVAARCDRLMVVVNATVPGLVAATRVVRRLMDTGTKLDLVLRGNGVAADQAAETLGLPVLVSMPDQRGIDETVGLGAGPLRSRRCVLARTAARCARTLMSEESMHEAAA